jgi:hypothetical protein
MWIILRPFGTPFGGDMTTTVRIRPLPALVVVAAVLLGGPVPATAAPARTEAVAAQTRAAAVAYDGRISRAVVIRRAADWLRRDIAYSQDNRKAQWDVNRGRRYRPDCSGFVAMAWALDPRRPGLGRAPVTWELPGYSARIHWASLRAGDILLRLEPANRAREHVVMFLRWADRGRTRAWIVEQNSTRYGMRRKTVTVAGVRHAYQPYRYHRIV